MPEHGAQGNPLLDLLVRVAGMGGTPQDFRGVPLQQGEVDNLDAHTDTLTGALLGSPADRQNNPLLPGGVDYQAPVNELVSPVSNLVPPINNSVPPVVSATQAPPPPANRPWPIEAPRGVGQQMRISDVNRSLGQGDDAYEDIGNAPTNFDALLEAALEEPTAATSRPPTVKAPADQTSPSKSRVRQSVYGSDRSKVRGRYSDEINALLKAIWDAISKSRSSRPADNYYRR